MSKKKKIFRRKIGRLLLKALWFCLVSLIVLVLGTAIFLSLIASDMPETASGFIPPTIKSALILSLILVIFWLIFRKSNKTLLRWTRRSAFVLAPLVVVVMGLTIMAIRQEGSGAVTYSAPEGLIGHQDYVNDIKLNEDKLLTATNLERTANNKPVLTLNAKLNESALNKCRDMVAKNYWSHNDPDGREPWVFIIATGYNYASAGENLAYGFNSEDEVVKGWMNSTSHRENILNDYSEVGFGVCIGDNYVNKGKQVIVVQHFATPQPATQTNNSQPIPISQHIPYVAPVCTKTTIPYQTEYISDPTMYVGETYESGMGWDGYKETCTADSTGYKPADYTSPSYNKKIYTGTKPKPAPIPQPKDYSICNQFIGSGAHQACVDAINRQ